MQHQEISQDQVMPAFDYSLLTLTIQCYVPAVKQLITLTRPYVRKLTPGKQKSVWQWMMKWLNTIHV